MLARVTAVSPVICLSNAPPFFMVEVEEVQEAEDSRELGLGQAQSKSDAGSRSGCADLDVVTCSHAVQRPVATKETSCRAAFRSTDCSIVKVKEGISGTHVAGALRLDVDVDVDVDFNNALPTEANVHRPRPGEGEGDISPSMTVTVKEDARVFGHLPEHLPGTKSFNVGIRSTKDVEFCDPGLGIVDSSHPSHRSDASDAGKGFGSTSNSGRFCRKTRRSRCASEGLCEKDEKERLMARLVLNGERCLAWQPFIVPGRTYVFPGMGAIVLGGAGSGPAYRAFGDALGEDRGRSDRGVRHGVAMPVS